MIGSRMIRSAFRMKPCEEIEANAFAEGHEKNKTKQVRLDKTSQKDAPRRERTGEKNRVHVSRIECETVRGDGEEKKELSIRDLHQFCRNEAAGKNQERVPHKEGSLVREPREGRPKKNSSPIRIEPTISKGIHGQIARSGLAINQEINA